MSQTRNGIDGNGTQIGREIAHHRGQTQETAQQLSIVALRQWEKALTGLFALPAAIATGSAASVLHVASWLERAFEIVEVSVVDIGRRLDVDATTGESTALRPRDRGDLANDMRSAS